MKRAILCLMVIFLSGCGPWLVKETRDPKGGVFGWRGDKNLFMQNYCKGGEYRETDSWDGYQSEGDYTFTVGHGAYKTQQNVHLQGGYSYVAFYCVETMPEEAPAPLAQPAACLPPCQCMCPQPKNE